MYAAGWKISCVWVVEKVNPPTKGNRSYHYWMAMKATSLAIKI